MQKNKSRYDKKKVKVSIITKVRKKKTETITTKIIKKRIKKK